MNAVKLGIHPLSIFDAKNDPSKMRKNMKRTKIRIQYVKNHYAKFKYKPMNTVGERDCTNKAPLCILDAKMSKFYPSKMRKTMKRAQNNRCIS